MRPETPPDIEDLAEIKVRIPLKHHLRLHAARYVTGRSMSDMVSAALEAYLAPVLDEPPR